MDVSNISGLEEFVKSEEKIDENNTREVYRISEDGKAFLVKNKHTIEVRCDVRLKKLLIEKYESVMESRYFGRGGIEIVTEGKQMEDQEIEDLVRLSYNLTKTGE